MPESLQILKSAVSMYEKGSQMIAANAPLFEMDSLESLKANIIQLEQLKYPHPLFSAKQIEFQQDNKTIRGLYIQSQAALDQLSEDQLSHIDAVSGLIRKLSIIGGMLKAMQSAKFSSRKPDLEKKLFDKANDLLDKYNDLEKPRKKVDIKSNIEDFTDDLCKNFKPDIQESEKESNRKIRNAEKYFVAELNASRHLFVETLVAGTQTMQMDVPFNNRLTKNLKIEYLKIYDPVKPPVWFIGLSDWEKDIIENLIPRDINGSWHKFENYFQSSAMQNLPGLKNARTNYLYEKNSDTDDWVMISSSIKTATPIPYEIGLLSERYNFSIMAIEQLLDHIEATKKVPAPALAADVPVWKPIVFFQSLLSGTGLINGPDQSIIKAQYTAIEAIKEKRSEKINIIYANDPINGFRKFLPEAEAWENAHKLRELAVEFERVHRLSADLEPKMQMKLAENLELIKEASKALGELSQLSRNLSEKANGGGLQGFVLGDRNKQAFKSAYQSILVEAMGGVVVTNCKSGKDRTGLDEIYNHAMRIYFKKYQILPKFNDDRTNRGNFVNIFVSLFNSMKIQEAAAANTPGSFGIKDGNGYVLCADINKALKLTYKSSNNRADINKPKKFSESEAEEKKSMEFAYSPENLTKKYALYLSAIKNAAVASALDRAHSNRKTHLSSKKPVQRKSLDLNLMHKSVARKKVKRSKRKSHFFAASVNKLTDEIALPKNVERFLIDKNELAKGHEAIYQNKAVKVPHTKSLQANESALNFIKSEATEEKLCFLEECSADGSYKITPLSSPLFFDVAQIFSSLIKTNQDIKLSEDLKLNPAEFWKDFNDKAPTKVSIKAYLEDNKGKFELEPNSTIDNLAELLAKNLAEKNSDSYLEFAYIQCLTFIYNNPDNIIYIITGDKPLLEEAYAKVCQACGFDYEKSPAQPIHALDDQELKHIRRVCGSIKKRINEPVDELGGLVGSPKAPSNR